MAFCESQSPLWFTVNSTEAQILISSLANADNMSVTGADWARIIFW